MFLQLRLQLLPSLLLLPLFADAQQLPPPIPLPPAIVAGPPSVSFSRGISLAEFSRFVLEDVLKKPFVLPPALISANQLVGVSTAKLTPATAESILSRVLSDNGFQLVPGPVYYVRSAPPQKAAGSSLEWITYRPKHRPISYFAAALPTVFPDVKFSFDKAKGNAAPGSGDQAGLDVLFAYVDVAQRAELFRLIDTLDVPVPRVILRALLLEVATDNRAGGGVKLVASALAGRVGLSIDAAPAGSSFTIHTGSIDAAITAFDGDSRFKTVSFPVLAVEHAQTGRFQVGSKIPISTSTTQDGATTRTVEYRDVGTIMTVVPQVVGDTVSVSVQLELSDVGNTATGTSSAPTILTRNLRTQTTLKTGQAVLLGNLQSTRVGVSDNRLFGWRLNSENSQTQSELVLMLYAEIDSGASAGAGDGATAPAPPSPSRR